MNDDLHSSPPNLSGADAAAVDALIDAGLDLSRVPDALRPRALRVSSLLALVDPMTPSPSNSPDSTLVDLTMARILRAGATGHTELDAVLCQDDAEALDAYVAAEFRSSKVAGSLRPRAERLEGLVRLVAQTPVPNHASSGLVERTMRGVAANTEKSLEPIPIRRSSGFRIADLVSVAAVLVMGVAVLWPILSTVKTYQQKGACQANLGSIATALSTYGGDNQSALPMATASYGGTWMDVGTTPDKSNSSNLFTLFRSGYAKLRDLACAGNPCAVTEPAAPDATDWQSLPQVSYSYYIMFGKQHPTLDSDGRTIILADKSPVVVRAASGEQVIFPLENSPNHGGRGQWALRNDGATAWLTTPDVGGDNIWLNREQEAAWKTVQPMLPEMQRRAPRNARQAIITVIGMPPMQGNELPDSPADTMLGP